LTPGKKKKRETEERKRGSCSTLRYRWARPGLVLRNEILCDRVTDVWGQVRMSGTGTNWQRELGCGRCRFDGNATAGCCGTRWFPRLIRCAPAARPRSLPCARALLSLPLSHTSGRRELLIPSRFCSGAALCVFFLLSKFCSSQVSLGRVCHPAVLPSCSSHCLRPRPASEPGLQRPKSTPTPGPGSRDTRGGRFLRAVHATHNGPLVSWRSGLLARLLNKWQNQSRLRLAHSVQVCKQVVLHELEHAYLSLGRLG
jgi:hypothetical protein